MFSLRIFPLRSSATRLIVLVVGIFVALVPAARAQQVTVNTTLTRSTVGVGEAVQLQLQINGVSQAPQPPQISVDGLDIRYVGPFTLQQTINGVSSVTVTHNYQVIGQRAGDFTIPPVEFEMNGTRLRTAPLALKVEAGKPGQPAGEQPMDKVAIAELVLPKTTAYVGEALPCEIRLYIDARVSAQLEQMPQLGGDGFTKTKLSEPRVENANRDGREYRVFITRTAITPSKAGKIAIGPSDFNFIAQIPRAQRRRSQAPFDMFDDFFNGGGFGMQQQRMSAQAPVVELDVKPLPAQGRPADFSGAVGEFSFAANGSPALVKIGDPVTMRLRVTGRGNFDRVSAPAMSETDGWRSYPASAGTFQTGDEVGTTGMKTFEVAVIPEKQQTRMPRFQFSYFDPKAEKYVTQQSDPGPLTVEGGAPPPPPPVPAKATANSEAAQPPEEKPPVPKPNDIVGIRYEVGVVRQAAVPLYQRREFLLAQLVPAAVLLAMVARRMCRRSDDERRLAALRQEKSELLRKLRSESSHAGFYDAAARVMQIETALGNGRAPGSIDAATACASKSMSPETAEAVVEIFNARAELLYAGGGSGDGGVSAAARERVLATIEKFSSANAKS